MKLVLFICILITLGCILLFAQGGTGYQQGSLATSCAAVTVTGACSSFTFRDVYHRYSWESVVGGTGSPAYSALTVDFECTMDGTNWVSFDQTTATAGEYRSVNNKPSRACRCNPSVLTVSNGLPTLSCQFVARPD